MAFPHRLPFQRPGTVPRADGALEDSLRVGMEVWEKPIWIGREERA